MKKSLLVLVAIIFAINLNTQAEDFSAVYNGDTIYYKITSSTSPYTVAVTNKGLNSYSGEVVIPDSVLNSGNYYKVTSIWDNAFGECGSLTSITIPSSVTSIGVNAFCNCSGLTSLTIPNSVTSIGNSAFAFCGLTSIIIPNSVTLLDDNTFYYCRGLTSIVIPNSVTSIGNNAFKYCQRLTSINIPNSVTSIGDNVFEFCQGLTSLNIPNSISLIGNAAFKLCSGLTSINISNSITSIGNEAFYSCTGLTTLTIGNSVISIGDAAFGNCIGLTSITSKAINPPSILFYSFGGVNDSIPIYVPCNSLSLYQQAEYWSYFSNYQCDPIGLDDELKLSTSTKLYPNPTNNISKLEVEGLSSDADVLVYDLFGRVIKSYKINPTMKELEIDLSGFAKGVYSVSLKNNDINVSKKLIVQ